MSEAPKRPADGRRRDDVERGPAPPQGAEEVEGSAGDEADQAGTVSPELGSSR